MKLKVAQVVSDSIVDGVGYRLTVFVQGCPHHCPGCHNPSTWDFDGGYEMDTGEIAAKLRDNPLEGGITFSGGEPFCQPEPLGELAEAAHAMGRTVWVYSGFCLEEIMAMSKENEAAKKLLDLADVLVDGRYQEAQRDLSLEFRGSRNQRIIDMKETRRQGKIVLWDGGGAGG